RRQHQCSKWCWAGAAVAWEILKAPAHLTVFFFYILFLSPLARKSIESIARKNTHTLSLSHPPFEALSLSLSKTLANSINKDSNNRNKKKRAMSLTSHHLFTNPCSRINLHFTKTPSASPPIISRHLTFHIPRHKHLFLNHPLNFTSKMLHRHHSPLNAHQSTTATRVNTCDLDSLLSIFEIICLISSTVIFIGFAVNFAIFGVKKTVSEAIVNNRDMLLGLVMLVGGVVVGALIRRRQWRRICREGGQSVNFVCRIEKLEEDLRNSATMIRVLSRQLEKLGIRFRVTRKTLKEPIAEAAALAQKNSEATRALAAQEDILEKELGEIQKVLLAMQEQQQKQLELIVAVAKSWKLWESQQDPIPEHEHGAIKSCKLAEGGTQMETTQTQGLVRSKGAININDRA
ncbi:hypothetical protein CFOL_v3_26299, partial [Cephalotus follicularis]